MNTKMILPATIAAGLHALVLSWRPDPTLPPPPRPAEPVEIIRYTVPDVDPPDPIDTRDFDKDIKPPPLQQKVPQLPDHYAVDSMDDSRPKLVIPPVSPGLPDDMTTVIPATWGDGNGSDPRNVVFDPDSLDRPLSVVFRESPRVGNDVLDASASVTVIFLVGKDGRVLDARIVDSSNHRLDDECLRAVRRWRFEPGTHMGVPVVFRVQQSFVFNPSN